LKNNSTLAPLPTKVTKQGLVVSGFDFCCGGDFPTRLIERSILHREEWK